MSRALPYETEKILKVLSDLSGRNIDSLREAVARLAESKTHALAKNNRVYYHLDRNGNPHVIGKRIVIILRHVLNVALFAWNGRFPIAFICLIDPDITEAAVDEAYRNQVADCKQNPAKCKMRFDIVSEHDVRWVRVFQGHSNGVQPPPDKLVQFTGAEAYHGTDPVSWESIKETGLQKRDRDYIHMAVSPTSVAGFRPKAKVIVVVDVEALHRDTDIRVMLCTNGVVLCDRTIPPQYLSARLREQ